MCGITGILNLGEAPIELSQLKQMNDVIAHRGPDGEGYWISKKGQIGFGHRRLSIIDLSDRGKQPMHYLDERYTIIFNGEIYNYLELREELIKEGFTFTSESDTEVLLILYHKSGKSCLKKLDGMFAFAIWDEKEKLLFCARDRFGEKPLYFHKSKERVVFASEIKQFWAFGIKRKFRSDMLNLFLQTGEVIKVGDTSATFYEGIYALPAASYMECTPELDIKVVKYWGLDNITINRSIGFDEATEEFLRLFKVSVSRRLRSDVPIGSSLSGGLDSSAIVQEVYMQQSHSGNKQMSFSARFKNYSKDEGPYIDLLLKQLPGIDRKDVFLDEATFEEDIRAIVYHQDEPFQSASVFAQYKVMQLASKNKINVLLDGQGADELLGGYEPLYKIYLKQLFYNHIELYRSECLAFNRMYGKKLGVVDFEAFDTFQNKLKRGIKKMLKQSQAVPDSYFSSLLKDYTTGPQLQQLLRYADRNAMAHSVEIRLPFLFHELVEFCFSLPDEFKMRDGWPKFLARKAFESILPAEIVWRKEKIGFETPESTFMETANAIDQIKRGKEYIKDIGLAGPEQIPDWRYYIINLYANGGFSS